MRPRRTSWPAVLIGVCLFLTLATATALFLGYALRTGVIAATGLQRPPCGELLACRITCKLGDVASWPLAAGWGRSRCLGSGLRAIGRRGARS